MKNFEKKIERSYNIYVPLHKNLDPNSTHILSYIKKNKFGYK